MDDPTVERVREMLDYDLLTGIFRWRKNPAKHRLVGDVAGSPNRRGYITIRLDKRLLYAHRLAWFHIHGRWPDRDLDHRNGRHGDNRLSNLRQASRTQNNQNQHQPSKNNTSGFLGVTRQGNRWKAQITVDSQNKYLGSYDTPAEAHAAYVAAKAELHPFWSRHG